MSLLREWTLEPGSYDLGVLLFSTAEEGSELSVRRSIELEAGAVVLISTHPETGELVVTP